MTTIYFGTNRNPLPKKKPTNYGKRFSEDGLSDLRFGRVIFKGKSIKVETHDEKLTQFRDTNLTSEKSILGSTSLFKEIHEEMLCKNAETIVYIHGYNVSFKEAMRASVKLSEEISARNGNCGVNVLCFSWPSDGSMAPWKAYSNDRRDAAASSAAFARGILKLTDFLQTMQRKDHCKQKIHLLAHSMGNYVLRHALQEIIEQSGGRIPRIFDQIFLMAADEDDDAFEYDHKLKLLPKLGRRVNVYFNREDRAMALSDLTKGNPDRLGDDGPRSPFSVPGKVTQIDCTNVVEGIAEHSYYLEEPRVLQDIVQVMQGLEPYEVTRRLFVDDRNRYILKE
ncbi:MAG: esterase/lipase superfamily enzyme [Candidatus Azotimanducaceae bacterium]|jgi:esterase/lipase superfamily enzyme